MENYGDLFNIGSMMNASWDVAAAGARMDVWETA